MEVTRRQGRRRKKLLDDLKDRRGYSHLKEEALDRTMWRNRFRGGFGPVVRQNIEWMNVQKVQVWLRRTNTASASHKELRVCTSVTLSYRLRQTYKKSVPKVPRILIYRTAILYVKRIEKTRGTYRFMMGNLKKRDHWRDLGINGRIILKHRINPDHDRSMWLRPLHMVKSLPVP